MQGDSGHQVFVPGVNKFLLFVSSTCLLVQHFHGESQAFGEGVLGAGDMGLFTILSPHPNTRA